MTLNYNTIIRLDIRQLRIVGIFLTFLLFLGWSAQGQQLPNYIEEAIKNNPTIQAVETKYAISTEKISEVKTLPNTEFSGGYMAGKNQMPMMPQGEFSVMQMLPWFGTISARTNYATTMADADFLEIEIAKRKISLALSQSYYHLYEIAKKQQILDVNIQLLQVYEQMALTSVEIGKASVVSVLRFQMRQNDLVERKLILEQDYAAELTAFNKIMNRKEVTDISAIDSLTLPKKDIEIDLSKLNLHPELTKFEQMNKVVSQLDALNKKESAPALGLGLEYLFFNETPNMLMPMASLSVPIFNKKYKSISHQNKLRYAELDSQKEAAENSLVAQLHTAVRNRNAARISLETQDKNLKQAQSATEILFKNYETGTIDFKEVLDVQELQLLFQINRVEAIGDYFKQMCVINYFLASKL